MIILKSFSAIEVDCVAAKLENILVAAALKPEQRIQHAE
jgi:hypothetical protein